MRNKTGYKWISKQPPYKWSQQHLYIVLKVIQIFSHDHQNSLKLATICFKKKKKSRITLDQISI